MKWKRATLRSTHPLLVVGPAFSGDKWDKWWITRGLKPAYPVDNLWIGKLIESMSCGEYKGSESCGGRRSGVASEWHCVGCSVGWLGPQG